MTITISKNCCDCEDEVPPCDPCDERADCEVYLNIGSELGGWNIVEDSKDFVTFEGRPDSIGLGSFLTAIFKTGTFTAGQTTKFVRFELWTDQPDKQRDFDWAEDDPLVVDITNEFPNATEFVYSDEGGDVKRTISFDRESSDYTVTAHVRAYTNEEKFCEATQEFVIYSETQCLLAVPRSSFYRYIVHASSNLVEISPDATVNLPSWEVNSVEFALMASATSDQVHEDWATIGWVNLVYTALDDMWHIGQGTSPAWLPVNSGYLTFKVVADTDVGICEKRITLDTSWYDSACSVDITAEESGYWQSTVTATGATSYMKEWRVTGVSSKGDSATLFHGTNWGVAGTPIAVGTGQTAGQWSSNAIPIPGFWFDDYEASWIQLTSEVTIQQMTSAGNLQDSFICKAIRTIVVDARPPADPCQPDVNHSSNGRSQFMANYGTGPSNTPWIYFKYKPWSGHNFMNWSITMNVVGNFGDRVTVQWRDCTAGTTSWTTIANFYCEGGVPGSNRTVWWRSDGTRKYGNSFPGGGMGPAYLYYIPGHIYDFRYKGTCIEQGKTGRVGIKIQRGW